MNIAMKLSTVKMGFLVLRDERKTSLMSVKKSTIYEKRTTAQKNLAEFG